MMGGEETDYRLGSYRLLPDSKIARPEWEAISFLPSLPSDLHPFVSVSLRLPSHNSLPPLPSSHEIWLLSPTTRRTRTPGASRTRSSSSLVPRAALVAGLPSTWPSMGAWDNLGPPSLDDLALIALVATERSLFWVT